MRGATSMVVPMVSFTTLNFNSHAPCGAQLYLFFHFNLDCAAISTHTPHAGRNEEIADRLAGLIISTHTPHAGRNGTFPMISERLANFNSHAPCGAQPASACPHCGCIVISTHTPHAGRNCIYFFILTWIVQRFQLTRPMRGATAPRPGAMQPPIHFNSHAPCGAQRAAAAGDLRSPQSISTHTPHAGRNPRRAVLCVPASISTHTPHAGRNFLCESSVYSD